MVRGEREMCSSLQSTLDLKIIFSFTPISASKRVIFRGFAIKILSVQKVTLAETLLFKHGAACCSAHGLWVKERELQKQPRTYLVPFFIPITLHLLFPTLYFPCSWWQLNLWTQRTHLTPLCCNYNFAADFQICQAPSCLPLDAVAFIYNLNNILWKMNCTSAKDQRLIYCEMLGGADMERQRIRG